VTVQLPSALPSEQTASATTSRVSAWVVVSVLTATAGVCLGAYGNVDPDVYWHRVLGAHWLGQGGIDLSQDPIAFTPGQHWFPTAWSVEVLYALIVDLAGYTGIFALRLVLAVSFYFLLGRYLHSIARPWIAALLFASVGLPAAFLLQDRPQTVSLVFCVLLVPAVGRALRQDHLPPWWAVILVTWIWANVHGLWILVPGLLALLTFIRLMERDRAWTQSARLMLAALAGAALTPVGPRLLSAPVRISSATSQIAEWTPTALRSPSAWGLAACLAMLMVCGLRGYNADLRRVVYVLCISLFGLWAHRNAAFASILLVPVVVEALEAVFSVRPESLTVHRRVVIGLVPLLSLVVVLNYVLHAGIPPEMPSRIADRLASSPQERIRVVADYNITGYVREFGGDRVRLSIDGRSDRYGAEAIADHGDMLAGHKGWRRQLESLRPDVVIVDERSALRELLSADGWRVEVADGDFVMLTR
jgi:hypothetical protein